jgi:ethanolamine ammonia-lyase large subunit
MLRSTMSPQELRRTLVLANAFKEGDRRVGGGDDPRVRAEARRALLAMRIGDIRRTAIVEDGVTAALDRTLDREQAASVEGLSVGDVRARLLDSGGAAWAARHREGLASEVIAAVVKVMENDELARVARAIANPLQGEGVAIGGAGHFGSRIQPNSPGDADDEILFSTLEGLAHGCGDVIIGLNPARDDLDTIVRLESLLGGIVERLALPTRFCVLSDLVKQDRARERTRVDVGFQSLAGTSAALAGMVSLDVDGLRDLCRGFPGLYFETGQGSEVTNGVAEGVDMVTLEARTYGVARCLARESGTWTIVNDVAGFIGPEVFRSPEQLERACLEDLVMARLHGLTMGLDVCATFHMGISPAELRELTARIVVEAAPAYLMAVAGNADAMLGYLTTSFREHPSLRRRSGRQMTTAMARRLAMLSVDVTAVRDTTRATAQLFAAYAAAGGDRRSSAALEEEGARALSVLRDRGFDLGGDGETGAAAADARLEGIYAQARRALYATIDSRSLGDVSPGHVRVRTEAIDRDDYLAHPERGERLDTASARTVAGMAASDRAPVRLVISDGLNADALNQQLRVLLPHLRRALGELGCRTANADIVIENGRVRAGYHVGLLSRATAVVHLIGERPGTGLDTLSAYITYGRDESGAPRWRTDLDHAHTTALCGIHPRGTPAPAAAAEIAHTTRHALDRRRSGVALHKT